MLPARMEIKATLSRGSPVLPECVVIGIMPIVVDLMDDFGYHGFLRISFDLVGSCDILLGDLNTGMWLEQTEYFSKGDDTRTGK